MDNNHINYLSVFCIIIKNCNNDDHVSLPTNNTLLYNVVNVYKCIVQYNVMYSLEASVASGWARLRAGPGATQCSGLQQLQPCNYAWTWLQPRCGPLDS